MLLTSEKTMKPMGQWSKTLVQKKPWKDSEDSKTSTLSNTNSTRSTNQEKTCSVSKIKNTRIYKRLRLNLRILRNYTLYTLKLLTQSANGKKKPGRILLSNNSWKLKNKSKNTEICALDFQKT